MVILTYRRAAISLQVRGPISNEMHRFSLTFTAFHHYHAIFSGIMFNDWNTFSISNERRELCD